MKGRTESTHEFNPIPFREDLRDLAVGVASSAPENAEAIGVPVAKAGEIPGLLGKDRAALELLDFRGDAGQALCMPQADGPTVVAIGVGEPEALDAAKVRDAAAAFGRATARYSRLAVDMTRLLDMPAGEAAQAVVEGVLLAHTAVIAGTATAVSNTVNQRGAARAAAGHQLHAPAQAVTATQDEMAQVQEQFTALQARQAETAALGESGAMIAQLQQLAQLKESGMLTDEEFSAAKARLIAG